MLLYSISLSGGVVGFVSEMSRVYFSANAVIVFPVTEVFALYILSNKLVLNG